MTTFQEFLNKVKEKENKKVKIAVVEVEGIGEIEFQRPNESELLRYNNEIMKCYKGTLKDKDNISMENMDMEGMALNASELIYNSCSFFKEKELRDMYKEYEFIKLPLIILGITEVLRIATTINAIFKGLEVKKETEEEIKNS
ncbi:hypothetical protein [Fusobacterium sp.]|uniref:hypothetical protein n=1 Tax=Fusobacterium sp. TaxID=68766 RepID=UPI002625155F|nr:hypothetical protein [Fusobacterium sp.]